MAAMFQGTLDNAVNLLGAGVEHEFKRQLRARLNAMAEQVIEEAAREIAHNLSVNLDSVRHFADNKVEVGVFIDTKKVAGFGRPL